jgi:hypothetical protein
MTEENKSEEKVTSVSGIVAGGNVAFGNISGQFAAGSNITQNQILPISSLDLKELRENLLEFQKEICRLGLDPDYQSSINGDISKALIETKKEKPEQSKIRQYFEAAVQTIKDTGEAISSISELYEPAKKIAKILGIAASFLI